MRNVWKKFSNSGLLLNIFICLRAFFSKVWSQGLVTRPWGGQIALFLFLWYAFTFWTSQFLLPLLRDQLKYHLISDVNLVRQMIWVSDVFENLVPKEVNWFRAQRFQILVIQWFTMMLVAFASDRFDHHHWESDKYNQMHSKRRLICEFEKRHFSFSLCICLSFFFTSIWLMTQFLNIKPGLHALHKITLAPVR